MKIGAPSADLLIKLALAAAAVGVVVYAVRKVAGAAGAAVDAVGDAAAAVVPYVNPNDPNNVAYHTVNTVGGSLVSDPAGPGKNADGSWSFGAWLYDINPFEPHYKG